MSARMMVGEKVKGRARAVVLAAGLSASAVIGVIGGGLAGCGASGERRGESPGSTPGSRVATGSSGANSSSSAQGAAQASLPGFDARDSIAVSRVRERALQVIEQGSRDSDAQVRANAIEAASRSTRRLRGVIERGLEDTNPAVRSVAAMTVGRTGLCDLASRAGVMAGDRNAHAQASGIFALARCGQPVNVNPLADILLKGESTQVRCHAAFVLGELGNASALPLLRRAVSELPRNATPEEQRILSLQLAEAMVKLGATEQRQVLRAALYPSRPEELEAAALAVQILGQLRDRESIDQLVYLTAYRDERGNRYPAEIRLAVAAALANMGRPQGGFIADEFFGSESAALRAQAAVVYGELRDRSYWGRLEVMMADPNPLVRVAAAYGVLRSEEATDGGR